MLLPSTTRRMMRSAHLTRSYTNMRSSAQFDFAVSDRYSYEKMNRWIRPSYRIRSDRQTNILPVADNWIDEMDTARWTDLSTRHHIKARAS